jgi:hypothetical protein
MKTKIAKTRWLIVAVYKHRPAQPRYEFNTRADARHFLTRINGTRNKNRFYMKMFRNFYVVKAAQTLTFDAPEYRP